MPKIGQMTPSKFLKKDDFPEAGKVVTFQRFVKENVARDNEPPEHKWVCYFAGEEKGLVMNSTNLQRAARAMGSEDTDDWIGRQIVAFCDPDIEFGGKLVGGIRLRAVKPSAGAQKAREQAAPAGDEPDDDIPFAFAFLAPLAAAVVGFAAYTGQWVA
jgi:hypothetical protein